MSRFHPLIFVVGPTGVGKSGFALEFAKAHGAVILNCDSVQMYKGLNIGTAKPTPAEQARVKHVLFDVFEPGGVLTAGDYRRLAVPVLNEELQSHPVLAVGGSGFYIQALEKGMFVLDRIPAEVEERINARIDAMSPQARYRELESVDPETADDLNPNDSYRIGRALIVYHGLGKKLSQLKKEFRPQSLPYPLIKMGLKMDRTKLRDRIAARTKAMLASGFIDEVRGLLGQGLADWPLLQSVGYRQVMAHLRGELATEKLADEITLRTVQLAKRQMTWFQRDQSIRWFDATDLRPAAEWLRSELDSVTQGRK